jgi:hypothetical protein
MLEDHFTKTVTISRKVITGNKTTFSNVGSIPCHIQPLSPTYQNGEWGRLGNDFLMFSTGQVLIGDKLADETGKKYEVFGVTSQDFRIGQRHYQAHIRGI